MPVIYRAKLKPGSEMVMQRYKNIYVCVLFFPIPVIDMSIFIHRCISYSDLYILFVKEEKWKRFFE